MTWKPSLAFLRAAVSGIFLASSACAVAILVFLPQQAAQMYPTIEMALVALVSLILLMLRRYDAALIWLGSAVWVSIAGIAFFLEGIEAPIYYVHPLLILFTGWVWSERAAMVTAALTAVVTVVLVYLDRSGWRLSAPPPDPLLRGIVQIAVQLLTATLVLFMVRAYRRRLHDVADASKELRLSEQKFSMAFGASPVAASISTLAEGRVIELNDNFTRDFGWSIRDFEGVTPVQKGMWSGATAWADFSERLRRDGRVKNHETVFRRKDGQLRDVSVSAEIIDINGTPCLLAYATDITERKSAEAQIHRLAFFDSLTGLPNRRLLLDRLGHAISGCVRHQTQGALLFIDLDNFKTLNDTHGHDKGDQLLQRVARRLVDCTRDGDTVARLGGDEFVVMLEDLSRSTDEAAPQAEFVGRKLLASLSEIYDIEGVRVHSTPSVGITLFGAAHESVEEPIKRADLAMYQAKAAGRNTVQFFDPRMQAMVRARAALERDLRLGLQTGQFELHYQPLVRHDGCVVGVEALLRWRHPERGMIAPGEFISLAEEIGLIVPLGEHVLRLACEQIARWAGREGMDHLVLSVNVSPRQFREKDFVAQVLDTLQRCAAPAPRLKLELTENLLVSNVSEVALKMDALKAHGVGFALDDFGTGYSSLSYLKRLPLDQLKIDRSFVRDVLVDPNDAAIARMVIVLAESLGLEVIAEGVETLEQQEALKAQGCHTYQGYLYGRPMTLESFEALAAQPGWPVLALRSVED